jgi:hypothetical protein
MPKPTFHIPRSLLIVLLIMITATLLVGMFRAFAPAHAVPLSHQLSHDSLQSYAFRDRLSVASVR